METIFGLPAHPLLVHLAVVLVPLVAIALVVVALVPKFRARFAMPLLVVSALTALYIPLVTNSGEGLEEILDEEGNTVIEAHASLGDTAIYLGVALVVAAALVWWIARQEAAGKAVAKGVVAAVTAFAIVVGAGVAVQTARIGHTGAVAAWGDAGSEEE